MLSGYFEITKDIQSNPDTNRGLPVPKVYFLFGIRDLQQVCLQLM